MNVLFKNTIKVAGWVSFAAAIFAIAIFIPSAKPALADDPPTGFAATVYTDGNGDGTVDHARVDINGTLPLTTCDFDAADWTYVGNDIGGTISGGSCDVNTGSMTFTITGANPWTTGTAQTAGHIPTIAYDNVGTPDSILGSDGITPLGTVTATNLEDAAAPVAHYAKYLDTNNDGTVDTVAIHYSTDYGLTVNWVDSDWTIAPGTINLGNETNGAIDGTDPNVIDLAVSGDAYKTGGAVDPTISTMWQFGYVCDGLHCLHAAPLTDFDVEDGAAPVPLNGVYFDTLVRDGTIDEVQVDWSENIALNEFEPADHVFNSNTAYGAITVDSASVSGAALSLFITPAHAGTESATALTYTYTNTATPGSVNDGANAAITSDPIDINDLAPPYISSISVSPSSGIAKVGDTVTLNIASDAPGYTAVHLDIDGVDITASNFQDLGGGNYSADYVVAEGDPEASAGTVTAAAVLSDAAHNNNATFTTLDANTLRVETHTPVVSALAVSPSTGTSKVGDTVTLNITADEAGYTASNITVNGVDVSASNFQDLGGGSYSADYVISDGDGDVSSGAIAASVVLSNGGNLNPAFTSVDANTLAIDANLPIGTVDLSAPAINLAGTTQTVSVTYDEPMAATHPTIAFNHGTFVSNGDGAWSDTTHYSESFTDSSAEEFPAVTVSTSGATDVDLNPEGASIPGIHNPFVLDTAAPAVSALSVSPSSGVAKVGDTVTVNITADEAGYTASNITVNGVDLTGSLVDDSGGAYHVDYLVSEGDGDVSSGAIAASVVLSDAAGNMNAAFTTVDANTLAVDANSPLATDLPTAVAGPDINAAEELAGFDVVVPLGTSGALAGDTVELLLGNAAFGTPLTHVLTGGEITGGSYSFNVASGQLGADGAKSITAKVIDAAGNIGAPSPALLLDLDTSIPVISATTPLTGSANNASATVGYTLSEAAAVGTIAFTRTGGTADAQGTHIYNIAGGDLTAAAHAIPISTLNADVGSFASGNALISGAIYKIDWNAADADGNAATQAETLNITYDTSAPLTPTAVPVANTYTGIQRVALASIGSTSIRYSITGAALNVCTDGLLYTSAITVATTLTITAIGCDLAGNISPLGTFPYIIYASSGGGGGGGGGGGVTISPTISIRTPGSAGTYAPGTVLGLEWSPMNGSFVRYAISYSIDGGATWLLISDTVTAAAFSWTIPNVATTHGAIKVDGYDSSGSLLASATSSGALTITGTTTTPPPAALPTVSPSGDSTATGAYDPATATGNTPDINVDKGLVAPPAGTPVYCVAGSLIKGSFPAVYFCGKDGKRYVFPNSRAYFTWYPDFSGVIVISDEDLAKIMLGGNVTYRPGVKMVKAQTDPKVYAISRGGLLRWISSEAMAASLYGANWNKLIDYIPDVFWLNYKFGPQL